MSELIDVLKDGAIAVVALNRPDAYNAFNYELLSQLAADLTALAEDESVRGVVIVGKGKAFCAGGDLKWVLGSDAKPSVAFNKLVTQFHLAILQIRHMKKPVVAAVNGIAAGGGFSLALASDFRVMEKSAVLKQAYTSAGLCIDGGGTFTLPRLVGFARALEIAAFDEPISSDQAFRMGLVTKVVGDGEALNEAKNIAQQLAHRSLHSFAVVKELLANSFDTSFETQIELERNGMSTCADHPDGREGLAAFSEKRQPQFGVD